MKVIKFLLCSEINVGTKEEPKIIHDIVGITRSWSEKEEELAKRISYNGEYTIEDDGKPEPAPTQLDRIEAQTTYTAMMTDTLMEG